MGQDAPVPGLSSTEGSASARFGLVVEEVRAAQGWTRAEVCGWSGGRLAYSTLAGIENGHRAPGGRTMSALAAGLGIPEEELTALWSALREGLPDLQVTERVESLHDATRQADQRRRGRPGDRLLDLSEQLASAQATITALARSTTAPIAHPAPQAAAPPSPHLRGRRKAAGPPANIPPTHAELVDELAGLAESLPHQDLDALIRIARSLAERRLPADGP